MIVSLLILPMTAGNGSYCESQPDGVVGVATMFISHSWQSSFLSFIDTLQAHFINNAGGTGERKIEEEEEDVFVWLDLFCINHHVQTPSSDDCLNDTKDCISDIGHTLVVLDSLLLLQNNERKHSMAAWNMFEVYNTVIANAKLTIILDHNTNSSQQSCNDSRYSSYPALIEHLESIIDIDNHNDDDDGDKYCVLNFIKQHSSSLSIASFNKTVLDKITSAMPVMIEQELQRAMDNCDEEKMIQLEQIVAEIRVEQKQFFEAEVLYRDCISSMMINLHFDDMKIAAVSMNLAMLLEIQSKFVEAKEVYTDCWQRLVKSVGGDHEQTQAVAKVLAALEVITTPLSSPQKI